MTPLVYETQSHRGEPVTLVQLIEVDLVRAYRQDPKYHEHKLDTGYGTVSNFEALRAYLHRWCSFREWPSAGYGEVQRVWIPTPTSLNYATPKRVWNTLIRKWPWFINEAALAEVRKHS